MRIHRACLLSVFCFLPGCEVAEEVAGICEDKWESPVEFTFRVLDAQWHTSFLGNIRETITAEFQGEIFKTYCNGTVSGRYTFDASYNNAQLVEADSRRDSGVSYSTLFIDPGMQYTYKFEHDDDKVTLNLEFSYEQLGQQKKYYVSTVTFTGAQIRNMTVRFNEYTEFPGTNEGVEYQIAFLRN